MQIISNIARKAGEEVINIYDNAHYFKIILSREENLSDIFYRLTVSNYFNKENNMKFLFYLKKTFLRKIWKKICCKSGAKDQFTIISRYIPNDVKLFIETGTYLGDMIDVVKNRFPRIYSIEINESLATHCSNKFRSTSSVKIECGDSKDVLPKILYHVKEKSVFWLDAHFSGGISAGKTCNLTPLHEIEAIATHSIKNHCIFIDDVDSFIGMNGYPYLSEIIMRILAINSMYKIVVVSNIACCFIPTDLSTS